MSDTPLFQHSDEQEAVYGGEQRPATTDDDSSVGVVPPSVVGGGLLGAGGAAGLTGIPAPATAPDVVNDDPTDPANPART